MSKAKPKFSVGQVVFVDDHGFYGLVCGKRWEQGDEQGPMCWCYYIQLGPGEERQGYPEYELRPLTAREIGPRKEPKP